MHPQSLQDATKQNWRAFLETYEPLRTDLYRYCRYLTRSPWDAEDLSQDTLARAFVTLAQMTVEPPNPRAWLFRVASNLWVDRKRSERAAERATSNEPAGGAAAEPRDAREAAGTLLAKLGPQERAAVVLKDVFDFSLEEIAETLGSTTGGIKAALHRGRGKLGDERASEPERAARPAALDAFCEAFNRGDIDGLTKLLLDTSTVVVVGATTQYGPEAARRTVLRGMLHGTEVMADPNGFMDPSLTVGVLPVRPRLEARLHRGRWVLVHWYQHEGGEEWVRAFTLVEIEDGGVTRLANYFYTPEFIAELGAELGVPVRVNGYRWCKKEAS